MSSDRSPAAPPRLPSYGIRSVVSFLIFVHLFALFVAITGSSSAMSSPLLRRLHSQLRPIRYYLQTLHMDLTYGYHLTQAEMTDIDHRFEVELQLPDGATETIELPDDSLAPRSRFRRYQTLGLTSATQIGNTQTESLIPRAIAGALMQQAGASQATVRLQGRFLQNPEDVRSLESNRADPYSPQYLRTLYEARVLLTDGELSIVKTSDDDAVMGGAGRFPAQSAPPPSQP